MEPSNWCIFNMCSFFHVTNFIFFCEQWMTYKSWNIIWYMMYLKLNNYFCCPFKFVFYINYISQHNNRKCQWETNGKLPYRDRIRNKFMLLCIVYILCDVWYFEYHDWPVFDTIVLCMWQILLVFLPKRRNIHLLVYI